MGYLEVKHMRLVNSIVETGSLTNASKKLNLTQPALSIQLSDIETKLGTSLFAREGKKLILTPAGEILYNMAQKVLLDIDSAEKKITQIAVSKPTHLNIASVCVLSYKWLPAVISQFQTQFPSADIEFKLTSDFIPDLKQGRIDMVVVRKTIDEPDIHYEPVFSDEMVAIMKPDNPLSQKPYLVLEDCHDINLVTFSSPDKDDLYYQFLRPAGIKPAKITKAEQPEVLIELVKTGFGVSILPIWSVKELIRSGKICAKPLTKNGISFTWFIAMREENKENDIFQWFINTVKKCGIV